MYWNVEGSAVTGGNCVKVNFMTLVDIGFSTEDKKVINHLNFI